MVIIHTCTSCKSKQGCNHDAFELYEEFCKYLEFVGEVEIVGKKCNCIEACCGHSIEIDDITYNDIKLDEVKDLIAKHYSKN